MPCQDDVSLCFPTWVLLFSEVVCNLAGQLLSASQTPLLRRRSRVLCRPRVAKLLARKYTPSGPVTGFFGNHVPHFQKTSRKEIGG